MTTASGGSGAAAGALGGVLLVRCVRDDSRERCCAAAAAVRGDAASLASVSRSPGGVGGAGRAAGLACARLSGVSRASVSTDDEHRSNDAWGRARRFLTLNMAPRAFRHSPCSLFLSFFS